MDQNNFDKFIRDKLKDIEETNMPSAWELLSKKLDDENQKLKDEDFDDIVRNRLNNFDPSHTNGNWEALDHLLTEKEKGRKKMIALKLVEAAIVLILISTFYHYKELKRGSSNNIDIAFVEQQVHESISATLEIELIASIPEPPIIAAQPLWSYDRLSTLSSSIDDVTNAPLVISQSPIDRSSYSTLASEHNGISRNTEEEIEQLATIWIKPFAHNHIALPEMVEEVVVLPTVSAKREWWISIPVSHDINTMSSTLTPNFGGLIEDQSSAGQSVGILISERTKNVEITTGIIYGEKNFTPIDVNNVDIAGRNSFLKSSLNNVNIRQMSVPLLVKGIVKTNSNWEPYTLVGVGFNAILSLDYDISREVLSNTRSNTNFVKSAVNFRTLPKGLLQDGGFLANTYINYTFGIGVQAKLKEDTQWYVQPTYQSSTSYQVNEIVGHMQSLRFEVGLRFRL